MQKVPSDLTGVWQNPQMEILFLQDEQARRATELPREAGALDRAVAETGLRHVGHDKLMSVDVKDRDDTEVSGHRLMSSVAGTNRQRLWSIER